MTRLDGSITEGRFVDGKANGFCRRSYASTEDAYDGSWRFKSYIFSVDVGSN